MAKPERALYFRRYALDGHSAQVVQTVTELLDGGDEGDESNIEAIELHVKAENSKRCIRIMHLWRTFFAAAVFASARKRIQEAFVEALFGSPPEGGTFSWREHVVALDAVYVE